MAYDDDQFDISDVEEEDEDSPVSVDEDGDPIEDPSEEDLGAHGLSVEGEEEDEKETF